MECIHFGKYGCADKNRCTGTLDAMTGKVVACGNFEPVAAMPGAILITLNGEDRFGAVLKKYGREIKVPSLGDAALADEKFLQSIQKYGPLIRSQPFLNEVTLDEDFEYWRQFYAEVSRHMDRRKLLAELIEAIDSSTSNCQVDHLARLKNIVQSYRSKGAI